MDETVLVIGVGQREREDDGVGPVVAERLLERGVAAVVHQGDGAGLLDLWDGVPVCVVVDAVSGNGPTGAIRTVDGQDEAAVRRLGFVHSTHRIGLPEALALGRALGRMPERLRIVGVTGERFGYGRALSPGVAMAAETLIHTLSQPEAWKGSGPLEENAPAP